MAEFNPLTAFNIAHDNRNFETEHFWKRALFFWGFIATALIGYATLKAQGSAFSAVISGFGLVCSVAWTLANRGSKYWQEYWEKKVEELEGDVVGSLFVDETPIRTADGFWGARKFSVSKLTIAVSDYLVFLWIALIANDINGHFKLIIDREECFLVGYLAFTALYIISMVCFCRSKKESKTGTGSVN